MICVFFSSILWTYRENCFNIHDLADNQALPACAVVSRGKNRFSHFLSVCLLIVQDEVYDEIYNVVGDSDRDLTPEDMANMPYLEQVIKETLRLYPTISVFTRQLVDDIKVSKYHLLSMLSLSKAGQHIFHPRSWLKPCFLVIANYVLPKGASVTVSPMVTHRCPHLYPNPDVFNPDNFSVENVAKRHKYSYIAFSGGSRGCIGRSGVVWLHV